MESKAGSILLLISGIITSLVVLLVFGLAIAIPFLPNEEGTNPLFASLILGVIGVVLLVLAILKFWASKLMKDPLTTSKGGIVALVVGVINGGDLLAIIGGILGIVQGGKQ